jgi:hypothetical protein
MPAGGGFHPFNGRISRHFGDSVCLSTNFQLSATISRFADNALFTFEVVEADEAVNSWHPTMRI